MYLHEDKLVFKQIIQQVSEMSGSTEEFVEKDYYVTMFLHLLSEQVPEVVFKGGTSLSKCHKVIKRFSEDIDIAFCNIVSQGKRNKIKECITEIALELGMVIPNLEETRSRSHCVATNYSGDILYRTGISNGGVAGGDGNRRKSCERYTE